MGCGGWCGVRDACGGLGRWEGGEGVCYCEDHGSGGVGGVTVVQSDGSA